MNIKTIKRDILIGLVTGFATGAIFLIGDGITDLIKGTNNSATYIRIKIGLPAILILITISRIMRRKDK